jgi:hypothetical protein
LGVGLGGGQCCGNAPFPSFSLSLVFLLWSPTFPSRVCVPSIWSSFFVPFSSPSSEVLPFWFFLATFLQGFRFRFVSFLPRIAGRLPAGSPPGSLPRSAGDLSPFSSFSSLYHCSSHKPRQNRSLTFPLPSPRPTPQPQRRRLITAGPLPLLFVPSTAESPVFRQHRFADAVPAVWPTPYPRWPRLAVRCRRIVSAVSSNPPRTPFSSAESRFLYIGDPTQTAL